MTEIKKPKKSLEFFFLALIIIMLIVIALGGAEKISNDISNWINEEETKSEVVEIEADLELYYFSDIAYNKNLTVELWFMNLGEITATNITATVRLRNQTGELIYNKTLILSTVLLRHNETNTGFYKVQTQNSTIVYHTVEINWDSGHRVFSRKTEI